MKKKVMSAIAILTVLCCSLAMADWDPGDGHIMADPGPQLPTGMWDIMVDNVGENPKTQVMLADDWVYRGNGPVRDAHLWVSWLDDTPGTAWHVLLEIYENSESNAPGEHLWSGNYTNFTSLGAQPESAGFTIREYGTLEDDQENPTGGWYDPFGISDTAQQSNNHGTIYQINIDDLARTDGLNGGSSGSLDLTAGTRYWLAAAITVAAAGENDPQQPYLGWHTSNEGANNIAGRPAMWYDNGTWKVLDLDSDNYVPVDLAFVMTPEPSGLGLLMLAGIGIVSRRKKRR